MYVDGTVAASIENCQCLFRTDLACDNDGVGPDLVMVLSTSSILEGEIAKARLQDEGIPVLLKGGGADPYGMGGAYVFVPAEYEVQSRLILETLAEAAGALEEPEST